MRIDPRTPNVESRIDRIEALLERLTSSRQDASLRASPEPERDSSTACDGTGNYQGDTAFQAPVNAFNAELSAIRTQLGLPEPTRYTTANQPQPSSGSLSQPASPWTSESTTRIQVGSRALPFPSTERYKRYTRFFFDDILPCHSCVNEAYFEAQSKQLFVDLALKRADSTFLALNYAIFACADILVDTANTPHTQPPGWQWYVAAETLVGSRKSAGRANITLIQFFIFEVRDRAVLLWYGPVALNN